MAKFVPLAVGDRFGQLVVDGPPIVERDLKVNRNRYFYPCRCDCGNATLVRKDHLGESTESCGCLMSQSRKKHFGVTTHGLTRTRIHIIWSGIIQRCTNPNHSSWADYGGRGITLCDEWRSDLTAFAEWAKANGYRDDLEIDRIDVNGNYCPENCRFATDLEQARNRRNTLRATAFGEEKKLVEWAEDERCRVPESVLRQRLVSLGWEPERAMTVVDAPRPERPATLSATAFGETKTLKDWVKDERCAVSYQGLYGRLRLGWDAEGAITMPSCAA